MFSGSPCIFRVFLRELQRGADVHVIWMRSCILEQDQELPNKDASFVRRCNRVDMSMNSRARLRLPYILWALYRVFRQLNPQTLLPIYVLWAGETATSGGVQTNAFLGRDYVLFRSFGCYRVSW